MRARSARRPFFPNVSPEQLHGIEINEYAHELAQITVWIGYIQWLRDNGFGAPAEPILKPLRTIHHMDAILAHDEQGNPIEPAWPQAEVIIGNPPFLGGQEDAPESWEMSMWTRCSSSTRGACPPLLTWSATGSSGRGH